VVRDPATHKEVLQTILMFAHELGLTLQGLAYSPITGGEGNIEFLAHWRLDGLPAAESQLEKMDFRPLIERTVQEAGQTFNNGPSRK
jgi:23S rRNA (cytidine1920-2'-O)/16S rRNA (cytidine1409-2'-O)-methyltransferase